MKTIKFLSAVFVTGYSSLLCFILIQNVKVDALSISSICLGDLHGCIALSTGKVKCWGSKFSFGQSSSTTDNFGDALAEIGDGLPYIDIGTGYTASGLSCGYQHTCIKFSASVMKCVGNNNAGQLGMGLPATSIGAWNGFIGNSLPEINIGSGLSVLDIALGAFHSCAIVTGNKAKCFGYNIYGQLGYGDTSNRGALSFTMGNNLPFVEFGSGVEIASIHSSSTAQHNCAILSAPIVSAQRFKCWGLNTNYQLGYGDVSNRGDAVGEMGDNLALVDLGTESKVKQLTLGAAFTCALLVNDVLKCFGNGANGQLGSGYAVVITATGNSIPSVEIDAGKTLKFISSGEAHTCIAYDDMLTLKCVGNNDYGQLGQGDTVYRGNTPTTKIPNVQMIQLGTGTLKISSINSGSKFNCVLFTDSSIKCFGANSAGQLLIGSSIGKGDNIAEMGTSLGFSLIISPTKAPTKTPTQSSKAPSSLPTEKPNSKAPTKSPSRTPTTSPTKKPTFTPTGSPTKRPTRAPSRTPTNSPVKAPTIPTPTPTSPPTRRPTKNPIRAPTTKPSKVPTRKPSKSPDSICKYSKKTKCKNDPLCQWSNGACSPL